MKTIIAGSRDITDYSFLKKVLKEVDWEITAVVSGCARGVDELGIRWANNRGIKVYGFPADWNTFGKRAGPIRNRTMAAFALASVIIWDGESPGTENMIEEARKLGHKMLIYVYDQKTKTGRRIHVPIIPYPEDDPPSRKPSKGRRGKVKR